MTRTFLAIELPEEVRAALRRELAGLGRVLPTIRWVDPTTVHLTLAFLGELDDTRLAAARAAAMEAARAHRPLHLTIEGFGTFGREWAPRVVWAGIGGQQQRLLALRQTLAAELAARGFPHETRPFSPHLTLARIKGHLDDATLTHLRAHLHSQRGLRLGAWEVTRIAVMKSELLRPAARYTRLESCPLNTTLPDTPD